MFVFGFVGTMTLIAVKGRFGLWFGQSLKFHEGANPGAEQSGIYLRILGAQIQAKAIRNLAHFIRCWHYHAQNIRPP